MVSSTQKPLSIAIVGGGLAGVSLARGLLRRGVSCKVYEAAPAFAEIGAGLSFALNSLKALEAVDPECHECFVRRCSKVSEKNNVYMTYRDGRTDSADEITTPHCIGSGQQAVHRSLLLKDMAALMPDGTFYFNKRLNDLVKLPSGSFTLAFEDGTYVDADAVIGTDGVKSKIRQTLLGPDNPDSYPKYSGEFGYRSLVNMDEAVEVLGEDFAKNGNVNIGDGALTTTYPVEDGTMFNIVAARDQPTWESSDWVLPANKETIQEEFKDTGSKMQDVVSLLKDPQKWSLWHHPSTPTFCKGRLCVIGDSAHASTPHQGAGAGQAFEDALVLSCLLANDKVQTPTDMESAFIAFDAIRRPRTLRVVETSRENGEVCMMRGEETGKDINKIKDSLDSRFAWIWYDNLDVQIDQAVEVLNREIASREMVSKVLAESRSPSDNASFETSTLQHATREQPIMA
ncbi:MAG: hypothetical protein M1831_001600 [Alyxoria varia]|nr:MAG: hypothetical protein M1831_001600 [Alyxoria varia]